MVQMLKWLWQKKKAIIKILVPKNEEEMKVELPNHNIKQHWIMIRSVNRQHGI